MEETTRARVAAWQRILGQVIGESEETLLNLADDLGIHPDTIKRWCSGRVPHNAPRTLRALVSSSWFPGQYRAAFIEAVRQVWPEFELTADPLMDDVPVKEIPTIFYSQIYRSFAYVADDLQYWTICNTVTHQMFGHLDADLSAQVSAMVLICTPPHDACVQSFYTPTRQIGERASPLSPTYPLLAGVENPLTDYTPRYQRPLIFDERDIQALSSLAFPAEVKSLLSLPVQRRGKIAGCLLVSSSRPSSYWNRQRTLVAYEYGILLGLAFRDEDFHAKERICLGACPPAPVQELQEQRFPFRQRVLALRRKESHLTFEQLEALALQDLERDLLRLEKAE